MVYQDAMRSYHKWNRNWAPQCHCAGMECRSSYPHFKRFVLSSCIISSILIVSRRVHRVRVYAQHFWSGGCLLAGIWAWICWRWAIPSSMEIPDCFPDIPSHHFHGEFTPYHGLLTPLLIIGSPRSRYLGCRNRLVG